MRNNHFSDMTYLIFDTETTGLFEFGTELQPETTYLFPHIVQLAWALCDENGNRIAQACDIIRPNGWRIPPGMIHGISHETAALIGKDLSKVFCAFDGAIRSADAVVAHNYDFDAPVVGAAFLRFRAKNLLADKPAYCTQKQTTNWAEIPATARSRGNGKYKWPSLAELHRLCGYGEIANAHDASADVDATANCFFHLLYTAPEVFSQPYFSK